MLTKEQREAIYRLALQQQYADLSDYIGSITVPEGWQVVPVEPTEAILDVLYDNGLDEQDETLSAIYRSMLAAAPTPPVVLPPLPPHPEHVYVWTDDEKRAIEAYARAALAQYGIKERNDE